jgi:large subunit ribosomal protein L20
MTRVKGGQNALKRRKNVLAMTKGYRFGRSTKEAQAIEAIAHAGTYAFAHRKDKKTDKRALWQVRINAAVRPLGLSYSKFIDKMKKANVQIDRKILSDIAASKPDTFKKIFEKVNS